MEGFSSSQQHNYYILDQTSFSPNLTTTTTTSFSQFHQHNDDQDFVANELQSLDSSMSMVLDYPNVSSGSDQAKRRKDKQMCLVNHADTKDKTKRIKKQKKSNDYDQEEKKKKTMMKQASCNEEGELGYVHVRARRGQATDSHSLAERARREKISERMKLLQAIVPGCDKVTGKALMLDEIINYVQSLKNQVEVLSMKLASVNPMLLYDSGVDLNAFMLKSDENMNSMVQPIMPMPNVQQCSNHRGASPATFAPATDNYPHLPHLIDGSSPTNSLLFQQSQIPSILSLQDNGHYSWEVDELRLKLENLLALSNNLTSFMIRDTRDSSDIM